jgi:phenylalanyl-tRNA synthetase beta chain
MDPDKDKFVPLGMPGKKITGRQILESHPKGMAYAELLAHHKRYPMLIDSKNQVLSMPPVINSEETKLKQGTTRLFIDVTGISQAAVIKSLDTLVCSLFEMGGNGEKVTIVERGGDKRMTHSTLSRQRALAVSPFRTRPTGRIFVTPSTYWRTSPLATATRTSSRGSCAR